MMNVTSGEVVRVRQLFGVGKKTAGNGKIRYLRKDILRQWKTVVKGGKKCPLPFI
jgi:hypothetical protein